jgi:hypothetical protein
MKNVLKLVATMVAVSVAPAALATTTTVGGAICVPSSPTDATTLAYNSAGAYNFSSTTPIGVDCDVAQPLSAVNTVTIVGYNRHTMETLTVNIFVTNNNGATIIYKPANIGPAGPGSGPQSNSGAMGGAVGHVHVSAGIPNLFSGSNSDLATIITS